MDLILSTPTPLKNLSTAETIPRTTRTISRSSKRTNPRVYHERVKQYEVHHLCAGGRFIERVSEERVMPSSLVCELSVFLHPTRTNLINSGRSTLTTPHPNYLLVASLINAYPNIPHSDYSLSTNSVGA